MSPNLSILNKRLSKTTQFGVKLWVVIAILIGFSILLIIIIISIFCILHRRRKLQKNTQFCLPISSKNNQNRTASSIDRRLLSSSMSDVEMNIMRVQISNVSELESIGRYSGLVKDVWNGMFSIREIEVATNGLAKENVIGNGYCGIMYHGILFDTTRVAVKRLANISCEDEDFITEVEAIGHVRHKNLVKLLGYCIEGPHRMLVYEYIDNGNLHQWLHGNQGQVSPLPWNIRVNIIQGMAKGLAYIHEDVEPKILHGNLKSTNILLDHHWNPKITDFGLSDLHITDETLGYKDSEYVLDNSLIESSSDIYSFGVLIMEIVSGRIPIDYNQTQPYLIEWLKTMVANQKASCVADPKLPEMPSLKDLKRLLLIALRCVDPDVKHRPKMGNVVHMLEPRDLLLSEDHPVTRQTSRRRENSGELGEDLMNIVHGRYVDCRSNSKIWISNNNNENVC